MEERSVVLGYASINWNISPERWLTEKGFINPFLLTKSINMHESGMLGVKFSTTRATTP